MRYNIINNTPACIITNNLSFINPNIRKNRQVVRNVTVTFFNQPY